jgi:hypothetical protein
VKIDSLDLQMRPRAPHEAADFGVQLCQANAREIYRCYFVVALPMALLSLSLFEISPFLPGILLWWSKPWLDRSVLFVLARAAFGQRTTVADLWRAQRQVWWSQLILTWTFRRLSPWRSFTQPVYQLEGLPFFQRNKRITQLRRRYSRPAAFVTSAFSFAETAITFSLLSLLFWAGPPDQSFDFGSYLRGEYDLATQLSTAIIYVLAVLFVEPFYVAAGFGMYLNRRTELEAWDIEQEFRRAFAT